METQFDDSKILSIIVCIILIVVFFLHKLSLPSTYRMVIEKNVALSQVAENTKPKSNRTLFNTTLKHPKPSKLDKQKRHEKILLKRYTKKKIFKPRSIQLEITNKENISLGNTTSNIHNEPHQTRERADTSVKLCNRLPCQSRNSSQYHHPKPSMTSNSKLYQMLVRSAVSTKITTNRDQPTSSRKTTLSPTSNVMSTSCAGHRKVHDHVRVVSKSKSRKKPKLIRKLTPQCGEHLSKSIVPNITKVENSLKHVTDVPRLPHILTPTFKVDENNISSLKTGPKMVKNIRPLKNAKLETSAYSRKSRTLTKMKRVPPTEKKFPILCERKYNSSDQTVIGGTVQSSSGYGSVTTGGTNETMIPVQTNSEEFEGYLNGNVDLISERSEGKGNIQENGNSLNSEIIEKSFLKTKISLQNEKQTNKGKNRSHNKDLNNTGLEKQDYEISRAMDDSATCSRGRINNSNPDMTKTSHHLDINAIKTIIPAPAITVAGIKLVEECIGCTNLSIANRKATNPSLKTTLAFEEGLQNVKIMYASHLDDKETSPETNENKSDQATSFMDINTTHIQEDAETLNCNDENQELSSIDRNSENTSNLNPESITEPETISGENQGDQSSSLTVLFEAPRGLNNTFTSSAVSSASLLHSEDYHQVQFHFPPWLLELFNTTDAGAGDVNELDNGNMTNDISNSMLVQNPFDVLGDEEAGGDLTAFTVHSARHLNLPHGHANEDVVDSSDMFENNAVSENEDDREPSEDEDGGIEHMEDDTRYSLSKDHVEINEEDLSEDHNNETNTVELANTTELNNSIDNSDEPLNADVVLANDLKEINTKEDSNVNDSPKDQQPNTALTNVERQTGGIFNNTSVISSMCFLNETANHAVLLRSKIEIKKDKSSQDERTTAMDIEGDIKYEYEDATTDCRFPKKKNETDGAKIGNKLVLKENAIQTDIVNSYPKDCIKTENNQRSHVPKILETNRRSIQAQTTEPEYLANIHCKEKSTDKQLRVSTVNSKLIRNRPREQQSELKDHGRNSIQPIVRKRPTLRKINAVAPSQVGSSGFCKIKKSAAGRDISRRPNTQGKVMTDKPKKVCYFMRNYVQCIVKDATKECE